MLQVYVPQDYKVRKQLQQQPLEGSRPPRRYPVLINFHGGGFTLGSAIDDARWIKTVIDEVGAVVVSVDYRLAPEYPFPTAVEDGTDAVLYVAEHAEELNIDPERIAISGFSAGGNMAFTVPLRLQGQLSDFDHPPHKTAQVDQHTGNNSNSSTNSLEARKQELETLVTVRSEVKITGIISWYPSTDYTQTREQRRMTNVRRDQELSQVFTELFDASYLHPPTMDTSNPLLSPGVAPREMLEELPKEIVLFTCEWDMLLAEGIRFRDRLVNEVGKNVVYQMVPGVPHAWDKAPNPIKPTPGVRQHYLKACKELKRIFDS